MMEEISERDPTKIVFAVMTTLMGHVTRHLRFPINLSRAKSSNELC